MPTEEGFSFFNNLSASFGVKAFLILFLVFYSVFALILFRQIQLMTKALPSLLSPFLRFLGILHIGVAVGFLFIMAGAF